MPWPMPALLRGLPFRAPATARMTSLARSSREMTQPERDRILAALGGDLIEEGFDRKHVALRTQRSQRRGADRHRRQAMAFDRHDGKVIERNRVAVAAAAIGLRRIGRDHARKGIGQLESRQQRRLRRAPRPRRVTVAPDRMAPVDDVALRIEIGLDLDRHRRAKRCIRHLVLRATTAPAPAGRPAAFASSTASSATSSAALCP